MNFFFFFFIIYHLWKIHEKENNLDKGIENARRGNIIEKKLKKIRQRSGRKEI